MLPAALRPIAFALPMTYWLEASRRALGARGFSGLLARLPDTALAGLLVLVAVAWFVVGLWIFFKLERRARDRGLLDITTAW